MREDGEDVRTPHGGRKLEEAYFSTGANAFLELELAKEVGAHGMVELGRLRRRKARALSFGSKTRRSSSLSSSSSSSSSSMGGCDNVVYAVDVVIGSGKRGCVGEMGSVESVRADVRRVE